MVHQEKCCVAEIPLFGNAFCGSSVGANHRASAHRSDRIIQRSSFVSPLARPCCLVDPLGIRTCSVVPRSRLGKELKRHHTLHHLKDDACWLAFTAPQIDYLLGTIPGAPEMKPADPVALPKVEG